MRASSSFSKKLEMVVSKQLENELRKFASVAACAGIKNDPENAMKAQINHYGSFTNNIPSRRFIWAATRNLKTTGYGDAIAAIIAKNIHDNPSPHAQKMDWVWDKATQDYKWGYVKGSGSHGTPVFAGRSGPLGVLMKIAKQMEINQYNAISSLNFIGPTHNKPSTVRIKGFDHPLEWTGSMENSIRSWLEVQ